MCICIKKVKKNQTIAYSTEVIIITIIGNRIKWHGSYTFISKPKIDHSQN